MVLERLGRILPKVFAVDSAAVARGVGKAVESDSAAVVRAVRPVAKCRVKDPLDYGRKVLALPEGQVTTGSGRVYTRSIGQNGERIYTNANGEAITFDRVYYQRAISVDMHFVLKPDDFGEISRTELYEIVDQMDAAIMPCLQIKDRFITIQDCVASIIDGVLHYEIVLDFTDYVQSDEYEGLAYELMQHLKLNLNDGAYFIEAESDEVELPDPSSENQSLLDSEGDD